MSIIGEAVLTASVELLLNRLVSSELLRFPGQEKVRAELKQWDKKLNNINAVLADAEEKQITNLAVKAWLVDLQILSYDVEDILDEFATELSLESEATTSKAMRVILNFKFNRKMLSKIKEITRRLQEITNQKNDLKLIANSEEKPPHRVGQGRIPTTSLNEPRVYGREKDQDAIIELLLKDDGDRSEDGISVIPIVGIGGVGKTTLAQNVYNDVRVESHFDLKAWACVSDDFDVIRVTQAILQSIAPETRDTRDLNELQVELKEKLLGKQFLIVLDDIWCENRNTLESLLRPFKSSSPGGKIIVTTRSGNISSMVGTSPAYPLKVLSDDDCFSIFAYHSSMVGTSTAHPQDLQKIGENIVKRCQGLPLAAKTLGGLLHDTTDREDWEQVSSSEIWNLPMQEGDIMPALRLSYHYLPPLLKPCFACCSLLPKDHEFEKEEIILLWMAQGFLQQKGCAEEQMEHVGDKYFRELQSKSFFQHSSDGSSRSVMHDLINDLAQWVAGEFFFRMENIVEGENPNNISKNLRHLSYIPNDRVDGIRKFAPFYGVKSLSNLTYNGGGVKMFEAFNDLRHLRTFLPLMRPRRFGSYCYLTSDILNTLPKLRSLRILSLKGYGITDLSDAIGDLKHLKYFDLSHTAIEVLPKSVGRLCNLQTLKLECCSRLKKLCEETENLIKLRYLDFSGSQQLEEMPSKIGKLTSLRTLSNFVVGNNCRLKELKWLKHLRGTLRISGLENINDAMDAKEADLSGKKNLTELVLKWSGWKSRNQMEVLDMLQPCNENLEKLTIISYGGMMFPTWLGNTSFSNLVLLRFDGCSTCTSLPSVGQLPSLKELYIQGMSGIKKVGQEFYGNDCSTPFPKLEILHLVWMDEWEEWISHDLSGFPLLRELVISQCWKLKGRLPKHLPSLKKLRISRCQQLQVSVLLADCDIEINGCLSSLNPLIFSNIPSHVFVIEQFTQRLSKDEGVKIVGYDEPTSFLPARITSQEVVKDDFECLAKLLQVLHNISFLTRISIADFPELVPFPELDLPPQLKTIDIGSCGSLKSLPESWMENTSLEHLSIEMCGSLTYLARSQLPPNLKRLEIWLCDKLQTLIQEENNNLQCSTSSLIKSELPATLEYISIHYCSNLSSLSSDGNLPKTLKCLNLYFLEKIEAVAKTFHNTRLEEIKIHYCPSLVSFPVGELPSMNLVTIRIERCEKLEAFTDNLHQLNGPQVTESDCSTQQPSSANFTQLTIRDCSSLVAFPDRGLPFTNLTGLIIENCKKLEALPNRMHNLTSLRELEIENCPGIKSFPPEDGFPTSLVLLEIRKLKSCKPLSEWGLHRLTSLEHLRIEGCSDVVSFPMEEMLPASLTTLKIKGFPTSLVLLDIRKLKSCKPLSKWGLHRLTSLEHLRIEGCSDVVSFPMGEMLPASLTTLKIKGFPNLKHLSPTIQNLNFLKELRLSYCPKLKSFPKKGLPLSLLELRIYGCPLLKQKCGKNWGKYWPLISHIPLIKIKDEEKYDLSDILVGSAQESEDLERWRRRPLECLI